MLRTITISNAFRVTDNRYTTTESSCPRLRNHRYIRRDYAAAPALHRLRLPEKEPIVIGDFVKKFLIKKGFTKSYCMINYLKRICFEKGIAWGIFLTQSDPKNRGGAATANATA